MLRAALKHFLRRNKSNLSQDVIDEVNSFLNRNDFHKYLRYQIIMTPIPKRIKKDESAEERRPHEVHPLRFAALQVRLNFFMFTANSYSRWPVQVQWLQLEFFYWNGSTKF